jgi:hypothetical protein
MAELNQPQAPGANTTQPWEYKWRKTSALIGFHSVNYIFSALMLAILFPISKAYLAPLLSSFIPISHSSLPKAFMVMTFMYWLPILLDIVRRWKRNLF